MRIALAADEPYPVHLVLRAELGRRGHDVVAMGAVADGAEHPWAALAVGAARAVAAGRCDEAILLCWSGTGVSIAANKVQGVRAALCADAATASAARVWNHANVLCLSHRTLTDDLAREILAAWFETQPTTAGSEGVARLVELERTLPGDVFAAVDAQHVPVDPARAGP